MKLPFQMDLSGKVAVVTGAGGVLCSVMAEALAMCGAKVALLDRSKESAMEKADGIVKKGYVAKGYEANVLDKESLKATHEEILKDFGTCDILINGAGGNSPLATTDKEYFELGDIDAETKTFFDLEQSGVEFVFNLNFLGTLLPTQEFAKDMVEKEHASILNIASMNAYTPLTKIPAYSGAKAAISNFTQWLAVHFSRVGIRVNAIAPGFILTDMTLALPEETRAEMIKMIPMRRCGEAEEVAKVALFLASDLSSYVSGQVLGVNGAMG